MLIPRTMEISRKAILDKTHYGLTIYAHVLQKYYPDEIVLSLSGRDCRPAKNPFNNDHQTLKICNKNWIFLYEDPELPGFAGDPFDFAAKHYQLDGDELLTRLNEDLGLGLDAKKKNSDNQFLISSPVISVKTQEFSLFRHPVSNTTPSQKISLADACKLIKSDTYQERTALLRQIANQKEAREYKATQFDYVTFSGVFNKRNDNSLVKHSGLLTIDFDQVPDTGELKLALIADEYFETELMFVSPSGDGLKWIIPIDLKECSHQEWFLAIARYIRATYGLEIDKSGKDISRACFLPFDPEAYINPVYTNQSFTQPLKM
jgi:hypothetical protein